MNVWQLRRLLLSLIKCRQTVQKVKGKYISKSKELIKQCKCRLDYGFKNVQQWNAGVSLNKCISDCNAHKTDDEPK